MSIKDSETMKKAVELASAEGLDDEMLRKRVTGLSLAMMTIAQVHVEGISDKIEAIKFLEKKIFSEENLERIASNPAVLLRYYYMAKKSMDDSAKFIGSILGSIDWERLKADVPRITAGESIEGEKKPVEDASKMLNELSKSTRMSGFDDQGKVDKGAEEVVDSVFDENKRSKRLRGKVKVKK